MRQRHSFLLVIFLMLCGAAQAQLSLDVESGVAMFVYNDVRIPGKTGTIFSLSGEFKNDPVLFLRARAQYDLNKRHSLLALYAPLTINGAGSSASDIAFAGQIFKANTDISTTWKFNSYRLSYQYNLVLKEYFTFAIGLTGKIRDAKIGMSNGDVSAEKTNLGIVPLVRFYADWKVKGKLHLILDGDALVGKQGRAEDILLAAQYRVLDWLRLKAGYRLLEGGADNAEVYNFSAVQYGVFGATLHF